jgi:thymidylate synthase
MQVTGSSGSAVYLQLLQSLLDRGEKTAPRGMPTLEIQNVQIIIEDPAEVHVLETSRRPSARITATEAAHLIAGVSSLEQLDLASGGRFTRFADRGRLRGAYGPRAYRQLERVIRFLNDDPDTRRAVVTLWRGDELAEKTSDVPCTLNFQFTIRDGKLLMRTVMRSNDAILGFPIDIEVFAATQKTVAAALGIPAGRYSHSAGSFHLYDRDRPVTEKIIHDGLSDRSREPVLPDGAIPDFTSLLPVQRWHGSRQMAESAVMSYELAKNWQKSLAALVPALPAAGDWRVCPWCRYITDHQCEECPTTPPNYLEDTA